MNNICIKCTINILADMQANIVNNCHINQFYTRIRLYSLCSVITQILNRDEIEC